MFLTVDDYRPVCDQYEFEQITQNEDIRLSAEAAAVEQISSYLRHRYDTDRIFSAVGECRNPMVVQCAVNISLWLMVHRLPQNMGHERRECLYKTPLSGCVMSRLPKRPRICLYMCRRTAPPTHITPYAPGA